MKSQVAIAFVAFVFALPLSESTGKPHPVTEVSLERPPDAVKELLADLVSNNPKRQEKAASQIAGYPEAEPFFKFLLKLPPHSRDKVLLDTYKLMEEERAKRNVERAKNWAKEGRYDFLIDAIQHVDDDQSDEIAEYFFQFGNDARKVPTKFEMPETGYALAQSLIKYAAKYTI